jgi:hypothetical protein
MSVTTSAKRCNLDRLIEDNMCDDVDLARRKVASKRHQVIDISDDEIEAIEMQTYINLNVNSVTQCATHVLGICAAPKLTAWHQCINIFLAVCEIEGKHPMEWLGDHHNEDGKLLIPHKYLESNKWKVNRVGNLPDKLKKNIVVITEAILANWEEIKKGIANEFRIDGLSLVNMPPMPYYELVDKCIRVGRSVCHKLWYSTVGSDTNETCGQFLNWMYAHLKKAKNQVEFDRLNKDYIDDQIRKSMVHVGVSSDVIDQMFATKTRNKRKANDNDEDDDEDEDDDDNPPLNKKKLKSNEQETSQESSQQINQDEDSQAMNTTEEHGNQGQANEHSVETVNNDSDDDGETETVVP